MLRYAITDCSRLSTATEREAHLLTAAARWADEGIDFVQLREKTLDAGELLTLAIDMMAVFQQHSAHPKLLISSRADVALATGVDGVHLTSHPDELTAADVRELFARTGQKPPLIARSCHSVAEVVQAKVDLLDFVVFGPVFEKRVDALLVRKGAGLSALREAVQAAGTMPVLALGGVDRFNTPLCLEAGAAGIAGIRLFS